MPQKLDVFRKEDDRVLWLGVTDTFKQAHDLMRADATTSARGYVVLNLETGIKTAVSLEEVHKPKS